MTAESRRRIDTFLFGVAIGSNGRCPPMLQHIVRDWRMRGAVVAVAGGAKATKPVERLGIGVRTSTVPDGPQQQGDVFAEAMRLLEDCDYVLLSADDILPVGFGWIERMPKNPGSIQAIRMIDLLGRRWFDWARRTHDGAFLQAYSSHAPRTFITGGSQLWSREARAAVSYRNRPYRRGQDAQICEDAEAKGIKLYPPAPDGPLLIHLDRMPVEIHSL